jgi:hypothetical protein
MENAVKKQKTILFVGWIHQPGPIHGDNPTHAAPSVRRCRVGPGACVAHQSATALSPWARLSGGSPPNSLLTPARNPAAAAPVWSAHHPLVAAAPARQHAPLSGPALSVGPSIRGFSPKFPARACQESGCCRACLVSSSSTSCCCACSPACTPQSILSPSCGWAVPSLRCTGVHTAAAPPRSREEPLDDKSCTAGRHWPQLATCYCYTA